MSEQRYVNTLAHHVKPVGFPRLIAPGAEYVAETDEQVEGVKDCKGQVKAGTEAAETAVADRASSPREGDPKGRNTHRREVAGAAIDTARATALATPVGTVNTDQVPSVGVPNVEDDGLADLESENVASLREVAKAAGVKLTDADGKKLNKAELINAIREAS